MNTDKRIIVALDTRNAAEARKLVAHIGDSPAFYKIGLELFASGDGMPLTRELIAMGHEVFVDLKLLDIPTTIMRATARIADSGARYLTVHAQDDAMRAAVASCDTTGILAVTLLTSVSEAELQAQGHTGSVEDYVVSKACRAIELGCAGVVCSPLEAAAVRAAIGLDAKIVTPGIRTTSSSDDQARTATIAAALQAGANHVVIGRQIRDAANPHTAFAKLYAQLPN